MDKEKIKHFKSKLEEEKTVLENELRTVGRINPDNPKDWEPTYSAIDTDSADSLEVAEEISGYQNNISILNSLEIKYNEVLSALNKIESGTFGICEISGEKIEEDRLEANPAAKTCKAHINN